ncbi:hypothetical protein XO08_07770 [Thermosipho sp. 1074]|nr:hypothetical protein XO08_07770 [Thermosipho sp. 1074]
MRWYVCTLRKQIIGRFSSKKHALEHALKLLKYMVYSNLYIVSEEDYNKGITSRVICINYMPEKNERIEELVEEYLEV